MGRSRSCRWNIWVATPLFHASELNSKVPLSYHNRANCSSTHRRRQPCTVHARVAAHSATRPQGASCIVTQVLPPGHKSFDGLNSLLYKKPFFSLASMFSQWARTSEWKVPISQHHSCSALAYQALHWHHALGIQIFRGDGNSVCGRIITSGC